MKTDTEVISHTNEVLCIDVIDGLRRLPSASTNVIIADPPYNIGKDFGACKDSMPLEDYLGWCDTWVSEAMRTLTDNGTMFIYGYSEILAHILVRNTKYPTKWLVWHYTNKNSVKASYWQRSHESILLLSKNKPIFNTDLVRVPYTEAHIKAGGKVRKATAGRFGSKESVFSVNPLGAAPRDVLKYPALAGGAGAKERARFCVDCNQLLIGAEKDEHTDHNVISHPTQKPIALTRNLIASAKDTTLANNNVSVLFSGTGAECVAAIQEGCNVVGMDINQHYVDMGNQWIMRTKSDLYSNQPRSKNDQENIPL